MLLRSLYYLLKPSIPMALGIAFRRWCPGGLERSTTDTF